MVLLDKAILSVERNYSTECLCINNYCPMPLNTALRPSENKLPGRTKQWANTAYKWRAVLNFTRGTYITLLKLTNPFSHAEKHVCRAVAVPFACRFLLAS
jgi:hypothetical protein